MRLAVTQFPDKPSWRHAEFSKGNFTSIDDVYEYTTHFVHVGNKSNRVATTSVYATPRLYRQILCGTNEFLTVNHNVVLLRYNNARL
jgi:hypothetical protein